MSTLGKIFVGLNVLLSFVVLGSAAALLQQRAGTADQIAVLEDEKASLQAELDDTRSNFVARERQLQDEKRQLQEQSDDLDVAKQTADRNAARLEADNQQLRDDVTKINSNVDLLNQSFANLQQRNSDLEDQNDQLRRDAIAAAEAQRQAEREAADMSDARGAAETALADASDELTDAMERVRELEALLEVAKASGFDATSVVAAPQIDGQVVEVDPEYGFVILDKGRDAGVQRGFVFEVYRGGTYIGQVRVDSVYDNYASAKIEFTQGPIQMFDRASTYIR